MSMKNDSNDDAVGSIGFFFIAKFVLLPLALALFYGVLGIFVWAIDILPGPGWVTSLVILFGLITYGWLSLKIEEWHDRRRKGKEGGNSQFNS